MGKLRGIGVQEDATVVCLLKARQELFPDLVVLADLIPEGELLNQELGSQKHGGHIEGEVDPVIESFGLHVELGISHLQVLGGELVYPNRQKS